MLPNLPQLAGDWQAVPLLPIVVFNVWTPVLPADPTRWAILFSVANKGPVLVWPDGSQPGAEGIEVLTTAPLTLYYKDFGPLVQAEWFCYDISGVGNIAILSASIRKLQPPQVNATEGAANVY